MVSDDLPQAAIELRASLAILVVDLLGREVPGCGDLPDGLIVSEATLEEVEAFDPQRTLLVDDSLPVLRSAREYGIGWLLAVYEPDTRQPRRDVAEFDAIETFRDILP